MVVEWKSQPKKNNLNTNYLWVLFGLFPIFISSFPVRIMYLSHWWMNAVLYGLMSLVSLLSLIYIVMRYNGNRKDVIALLISISMLLTSWQSLVSLSEVGNCWVEESRYGILLILCRDDDDDYRTQDRIIGYWRRAILPLGVFGTLPIGV